MTDLSHYYKVNISNDHYTAQLHEISKQKDEQLQITEQALLDFLYAKNIRFGIQMDVVQALMNKRSQLTFPVTIAKGVEPEAGLDGVIDYAPGVRADNGDHIMRNFWDIVEVPTVHQDQLLATIIAPSKGKDGRDVLGNTVPSLPGKANPIRPGTNVYQKEQSYYARVNGQISIDSRSIGVFNVYTINQTLSLKQGNIEFDGTIEINGDVPTGYKLKAKGDIKVHGLVEAATLEAGGSVYITEGFNGMKKGIIRAGGHVQINYINQGTIDAKDDIFVAHSILHSHCMAGGKIIAQQGNIIGGVLSAGKQVKAHDVGNRMNTSTEIVFNSNQIDETERAPLIAERDRLLATLDKLHVLGRKLDALAKQNDPKVRVNLLRQRRSVEETNAQLLTAEDSLHALDSERYTGGDSCLIVQGTLFGNTLISFGKYREKMGHARKHVKVQLKENEIVKSSL